MTCIASSDSRTLRWYVTTHTRNMRRPPLPNSPTYVLELPSFQSLIPSSALSFRTGTIFALSFHMRIAIAIWDGRISPVFDVAQQLVIVDFPRDVHAPASPPIALLPGLARVDQLVGLRIERLICGGISCALHQNIEARGIEVIHNVAGALPDVLASYEAGQLLGCPQRRRGAGRRSLGRGRCGRLNTDRD